MFYFTVHLTVTMYQFAIIGCGHVAGQHAAQISKVGTLKAVCDIDAAKANELATQYGAKVYNNINDLLKLEKDISIVVVCTPNGLHAEHAIKSIQGGKHVLCEEPMCITAVAASQINDTAHFFRRRFFIVNRNKFNKSASFTKDVLKQNKIGALSSFKLSGFWDDVNNATSEKETSRKIDGGIMYTQFHHYINLLVTTLGMRNLKSLHDPQMNAFAAVAQTENNVIGTLHFIKNNTSKKYHPAFQLFGIKGLIEINGQQLDKFNIDLINEEDALNDIQIKNQPDPFAQTYADMIASMNERQSKDEDVQNAIKTVTVLEQLTQNAYAE